MYYFVLFMGLFTVFFIAGSEILSYINKRKQDTLEARTYNFNRKIYWKK